MVAPGTEHPGAGAEGSGGGLLTRKRITLAVLAVLAVALAGAGGYVAGDRSGVDLEAARVSGEKAGWRRGTAIGGEAYPAGLAQGRQITYGRTFRAAYRIAYLRAYKGSGVDAPREDKIEVNRP